MCITINNYQNLHKHNMIVFLDVILLVDPTEYNNIYNSIDYKKTQSSLMI